MVGELLEVQCHHQQQINILEIPHCLKLLPLIPGRYLLVRINYFTATTYINRQDRVLCTTMLKLAEDQWCLVSKHLIPLRNSSGKALGRLNYICFAEAARHHPASTEHRAAVYFILGNGMAGNTLSKCVAIWLQKCIPQPFKMRLSPVRASKGLC